MQLIEACEFIVDCPHTTAKDEGYGFPLVRTPNIGRGRLHFDNVHRVSESVYNARNKRAIPQTDDLIFAREAPVGNVAIIRPDQKVCLGQRTVLIRPNKAIVDPSFLVYYLLSPIIQHALLNSANGATVSHLNMSDIRNLEIKLPSLDQQRKIGAILSLIDERIIINESINQNLLQQVTAFFHDYFDEYEFSPEDTMLLGDVARFKYGTMPKKDKLGSGEYVAFSGYQVVGSYPEKMFSDPQLIVVARGVGGCGDIKYTPADCYLTNLSIAILTSSIAMEDYLFNYLRLHDTKVMNTGSAQPQITVSTLEKYQLPIPPLDRLQSFSALVQPYKSMYRKNKDENERLQMLRDTLLPRLMSGELDVSEIDL